MLQTISAIGSRSTYDRQRKRIICKPLPKDNCLRLVYMEAEPHSNPVLVKSRRRTYYNIGKAFLAFAVVEARAAGMEGTLSFKAKTTELYYHYIRDFNAIPLGYAQYELLLLAEDGQSLLQQYYIEEERDHE